MTLHARVVESALTEFGLGAASAWDQVNPVGVSKQTRKVIGVVPMPLNRKLQPGELLDPDLFESLHRRVVESYPNRVRGQAQAQDVVPSKSEPDNSDTEDGVEQPMDNPLPGGADRSTLFRAGGSRHHQRRRRRQQSRNVIGTRYTNPAD